MRTVTLFDLAKVIRSKNAGNHFYTFDIIFHDRETYAKVKASGVLTPQRIAEAFQLPVEAITHFTAYDPGNAFKATVRRPIVSGAPGESDVYGSQQYIPLLGIEVPWDDE